MKMSLDPLRYFQLALLVVAGAATGAEASDFESRYYRSVMSGDLSWVADAKPETLSEESLKSRFESVFLAGRESGSFAEIDDPLVRAIVRRFHD